MGDGLNLNRYDPVRYLIIERGRHVDTADYI
jgi:hypothetical protein